MNRSFVPILCACALIAAAFVAGCTNAQQGSVATGTTPMPGSMTAVIAGGKSYSAYIAAPVTAGKHPRLVLLHSFNGLEPGYKDLCNRPVTDMLSLPRNGRHSTSGLAIPKWSRWSDLQSPLSSHDPMLTVQN